MVKIPKRVYGTPALEVTKWLKYQKESMDTSIGSHQMVEIPKRDFCLADAFMGTASQNLKEHSDSKIKYS